MVPRHGRAHDFQNLPGLQLTKLNEGRLKGVLADVSPDQVLRRTSEDNTSIHIVNVGCIQETDAPTSVCGCDVLHVRLFCLDLFGSQNSGSYHSCKVVSNIELVGHELYLKLPYTATLSLKYGYVFGLCLLRSNCLKFGYGDCESNSIAIQIQKLVHFV